MTARIGGVVIIAPQAPQTCARCGRKKECRDVLGNGSAICFDCATEAEKDAYGRRLFGVESEES